MSSRPLTIWFTGYSGSGKSTLAQKLSEALSRASIPVQLLDGDTMRAKTGNRSFSREARLAHLSQMGLLARDYSLQGQVIIAAFITPYEESRQALRKSCPGYFEVWIDSSLATCEGRDVKGLYAKARSGEIKSFTGISDVFEEPKSFDLRIKTDDRSVEDSLSDLLRGLNEKRGFSF